MALTHWRAALSAALLVLLGGPCLAQDVTLTARDGSLALSGSLQGFDGAFYRIDTRFGLLTVDADGVICDGPGCPDLTAPKAVIRIVGEGRAGEALLPPLLAAFAKSRGLVYRAARSGEKPAILLDPATNKPLAEITFSAMTADLAKTAILTGRADVLLGAAEEPDLRLREVALDALVPIVAPDNPIPFVTTPDLARALSGEIDNWNQIGGTDMPLVLHATQADSDLARALAARLGRDVAAVVRHGDMDALARAVASDPWALAVTGRASAAPARILPLRDSCGFALLPDPMAVKAGDYPLSMPVFFQMPKRHIGLVLREFLEFLSDPAAEAAVAQAGYIDRAVSRQPLSADGLRLINAINGAGDETTLQDLKHLTALMDGMTRTSMTFRFEGGSVTLDAHSRAGLLDLAKLLEAEVFKGQDLVLAGFSDGSGAAKANLELSRSRAEAVLAALRQLAPDLAADRMPRVESLGEVLPIACDETGAGRRLNRRVELWMKPKL